MRGWMVFFAIVGWGAYNWYASARPVARAPGVLAPEAPVQVDYPPSRSPALRVGDYTLRPVAELSLHARLLGKQGYRTDREADLAPYDLALGWGVMSDESVLAAIEIRQAGRFLHWRADRLPVPAEVITASSANLHVIPASEGVAERIAQARPGQLVRVSGQLVNVTAPDGWRWQTSTSRTDSGKGACEILLVREFSAGEETFARR